jgi:hypothetical protein
MKWKILIEGIALLALAFCLACAPSTEAQSGGSEGANKAPEQFAASNYTVSGPYSHKNLTIFLLHGSDQSQEKAPATLDEAMERKMVVVHETGDVNNLSIENLSDEEVYVQSGDIVKGGRQDRVLAMDLIVPPKSGKVQIASFCVEQGRWSGRGAESAAAFSSSKKSLNSKELKIAAKHSASQREVWDKVAKSQTKLSEGVVAAEAAPAEPVAAGGGGGGARPGRRPAGFSVASEESSSSLQLSLENENLKQVVTEYIKNLSPVIEGKNDAIGYVFSINGQINSADVYSSNALFKKLWPKLIESSATEAVGEFEKGKAFSQPQPDAVKAFLTDAESGKADEKEVTSRVISVKRESEKNLLFETQDRSRSKKWLHRNYLVK